MCGNFRDTWQNGLFYRQQIAYTLRVLYIILRETSLQKLNLKEKQGRGILRTRIYMYVVI